jgi:hypothetical protein
MKQFLIISVSLLVVALMFTVMVFIFVSIEIAPTDVSQKDSSAQTVKVDGE